MEISLSPIMTMLVEVLTIVLLALGGFAVNKVREKFGIEAESDVALALHAGIDRAIHFAMQKVAERGESITVNVQNEIVANATKYIVDNFPGTLARFGLTEQRIADLVLAHLPFLPGEPNG